MVPILLPAAPVQPVPPAAARLMRAARAAQILNPRNAGLHPAPPVITDAGTSLPAATPTGFPFAPGAPGVWRQHGGQPTNAGGTVRFTSAVLGATGGTVGLNNGRNANWWRVTATVGSRYLAVKVYPTAVAYRFLVDGRYLSAVGTVTATTTGNAAQYLLLDFGVRAVRRITIEGMGAGGFAGAYTEATGRVWPADLPDEVRVAFLGDSYVQGASATHYGDGVAPVMGDWLGARVLASGSGGTGWNHPNQAVLRFDQRIAAGDLGLDGAPDLVCLMASVNDRTRDPVVIQANALAGLRSARAQAPGVPIVVFGCMPIPAGPLTGTPSITATEVAVSAAVATFADPLCRFVPVTGDPDGAWVTGTGAAGAETGTGMADWAFVADKTHLNEEGAALIGRRYAQAVLSALAAMGVG